MRISLDRASVLNEFKFIICWNSGNKCDRTTAVVRCGSEQAMCGVQIIGPRP